MRINGVSSISNTNMIQSTRRSGLADKTFNDSRQRVNSINNIDNRDRKNNKMQIDLLTEAVDNTNKMLEGYNRRFEISIHEGTNAVMVKVIDQNTDEIIREIPPEKILDMVAALWEMAGIIVDRKI